METDLNQPEIKLIETTKGLLIHGNLPGIEHVDAEIQDKSVTLSGRSPHGHFRQAIPLQAPIDSEHAILAYHDNQLRMVLPWRNER